MSFRTLAELAPLLAVALLAWLFPSLSPRVAAIPSRLLRRLARTPGRAMAWAGVLSFVPYLVICWVYPPHPRVPDEFSHLVIADTFAHGRVTNPQHPLWQHFESIHVVHKPTYQSKFPPAHGLFLAAGQVLTGYPLAGAWLTVAAGAVAVCWMLLAWMPPRWALFGALLPAFRFGGIALWDENWFAYWGTTVWGGGVAMLGGALLFGALPRLRREPRWRDAACMGIGLIFLANTRPYEGLAAALPAGVLLAVWAWARWSWAARVAIPTTAVLLIGFLAMGYYNYHVTGDALKMPYVAHTEQYEVAPLFVFGEPRTGVTYNNDALRSYHQDFMMECYRHKAGGAGLTPSYLSLAPRFFWGFALYPAVLFAFGSPTKRWSMFAAATIVLVLLASAGSAFSDKLRPHYIAPIAPLFIFLAVAGLRRLRVVRVRGGNVGRPVAETIIVLSMISVALGLALRLQFGAPYRDQPLVQYRPPIIEKLNADPGDDLVIVTYQPDHNFHDEWIVNGADLEGAPVVWARDLGPAKNQELLAHYQGRNIWRLYADEIPPKLQPYNDE